jgi:hypothetical protein
MPARKLSTAYTFNTRPHPLPLKSDSIGIFFFDYSAFPAVLPQKYLGSGILS